MLSIQSLIFIFSIQFDCTGNRVVSFSQNNYRRTQRLRGRPHCSVALHSVHRSTQYNDVVATLSQRSGAVSLRAHLNFTICTSFEPAFETSTHFAICRNLFKKGIYITEKEVFTFPFVYLHLFLVTQRKAK